jgi:uncharacterized protein with PIN domain
MVVDTSAVVAILRAEPEADRFAELIEAHDAAISTGPVIEATRALSTGSAARTPAPCVWRFRTAFRVRLVAATATQVRCPRATISPQRP